jgi:hypothetical protein
VELALGFLIHVAIFDHVLRVHSEYSDKGTIGSDLPIPGGTPPSKEAARSSLET